MKKEEITKKLDEIAKEISKLRKEVNKSEEKQIVNFEMGGRYSCEYRYEEGSVEYIGARASCNTYILTNLKNGNYFTQPVPIEKFNSKDILKDDGDYVFAKIA